jgi:hypothetical protein
MRSSTLDPTAGERARRIRGHPEGPERISDPMDSRFGEITPSISAFTAYPGRDRRSHRPGMRRELPVSGRSSPPGSAWRAPEEVLCLA